MSFIDDAVKALDKSSEAAAKEVKASLEMLDSLAQAKKTEMITLMDARVRNAKDRKEIPPGTVLYDHADTHVVSSKGPSEGITKAVDLLLQNAEANWKTAVGGLIGTGLNILLGAASGGTATEVLYVIALDGHPADPNHTPPLEETYVAVRIDYALWVYNFKRQGITDMCESAVVYSARRSTLDYENMPSALQIDQSLKDIGMPKPQRDDILSHLKKAEAVRAKNMLAFAAAFPGSDIAKHVSTVR